MRILLTADPFIPVPPIHYGGIERIIATLASTLQDKGHTVGLVALAGSSAPLSYFRAWTKEKPSGCSAHAANIATLSSAVSEFKPELVHSFSRLLYLLPLLPTALPKIMSYQRPVGGKQIKLSALVGGKSLVFTGCSQFIADMGQKVAGDWHAIPNFVDTALYKFEPNVSGNAPLVFLSRIEAIKGAHLAIAAAKRVGRRLLIAGNHSSSAADASYWESQIKPELGRNGIEYVGPVDDRAKVELLGSAAALIVPIQWDEPFGIVFIEALACGTPVIACPRGALPEIVQSGTHGFLVRSFDEAVESLGRLEGIDRQACRDRVEAKFSADVACAQYESLYNASLRIRKS